jgi:hypothetical protein
MLSGRSIAATGLAAILGMVGGAQAFDGPKYPDWKGQWRGFFAPEFAANGPGQAFAGWDRTKPWGLGQQAPLTPEYRAVLEASLADQAKGGLGNFPTTLGRAAGMPNMMMGFGPQEYVAMIGLVNLAPACTLYYILVAGAYRDPTSLVALVASIVVLSLPIWAVHTPYLAESFRTEIRSSGYGISYSLATILPGLYSFYMLGLAKLMPYQFGPIVLLALGGALLSIGALAGSETKDVDLRPEELGYRSTGLRS